MSKRIVSTPDTLGGSWRFDGTRIPVLHIGLLVFRGTTYGQILEDYPSLDEEDIDDARAWLPFSYKWDSTSKIRPFSKRWKFRIIWFLDGCDVHILRHRIYWVCCKLADSKWWTTW